MTSPFPAVLGLVNHQPGLQLPSPQATRGSSVFFSAIVQDRSLCTSSDVIQGQPSRALLQVSHTAVTSLRDRSFCEHETYWDTLGRQPTFQTGTSPRKGQAVPKIRRGFTLSPPSSPYIHPHALLFSCTQTHFSLAFTQSLKSFPKQTPASLQYL